MSLTTPTLSRQLEELNLLTCSLLPGEELTSIPPSEGADHWADLLERYPDSAGSLDEVASLLPPARLRVCAVGMDVWFDVEISQKYEGGPGSAGYSVSVKGETLARREHERWQAFMREKMDDVQDSEYPIYELISAHLLPRVHTEFSSSQQEETKPRVSNSQSNGSANALLVQYHALFTSHHLVSPNKRRSLQQWSGDLSVIGFAKVGHPGVIYCEGPQQQVEEFVASVKTMQWLALRLRFIEPLSDQERRMENKSRRWTEFEKVGEVVEEMRKLGRESYVVEMGIGSTGTSVGGQK